MPRFSQRSKDNLIGVDPDLARVMNKAIKESPIDFTITEGLRSDQRQKDLYAQGRTKPGKRVTNADGVHNLSNHQDAADGRRDGFGSAVDLYPFVNGKVQVDGPDVDKWLRIIAGHIKKVGRDMGIPIEWGGDWKFVDAPHFQLKRK